MIFQINISHQTQGEWKTDIVDNRIGTFNKPFWGDACVDGWSHEGSFWLLIKFIKCHFDDEHFLKRKKPRFALTPRNKNVYESKSLLDFTFVIDGQEVKGSRYILAQHSRVFQVMFENEWKDTREQTTDINDVSFQAMSSFVKMLHGIECENITPLVAVELIYIAEKYEVVDLIPQAREQIIFYLNKDNAMDVLLTAIRLGLQEIEKEILEFITMKILKSDEDIARLDEDVPSDILMKVIKAFRKSTQQ